MGRIALSIHRLGCIVALKRNIRTMLIHYPLNRILPWTLWGYG